MKPQTLSVKRAQVEFHNFASLGEPERALTAYREENRGRGAILRNHLSLIGSLSPFLEIGANVGHTSYLLCNEFGAEGYALDISSDALRHGRMLQTAWNYDRAPVRIAGDGANLPFRDGSLRFVMTFQTLSQFMDLEHVFREVTRVLAPGGVFLFAEEPLRRLLSLRLYRCPYYNTMKPWERRLFDWGLLGYLVQDVIGAHQEESFGIRQNHTMSLKDWDRLVRSHFTEREYELFVPERGWGERIVKQAAVRLDPYRSVWRAARLLGGTLAAVCRKGGEGALPSWSPDDFHLTLRCPDCNADLVRHSETALRCRACSFTAPEEEGVYNLLPSEERRELYPGDRADMIDFSLPGHESRLGEGWYDVEGVYGNRYRWIGPDAVARLERVSSRPQQLRIRGHLQQASFDQGKAVVLEASVNGERVGRWVQDRTGLFVVEADVPDAAEYLLRLHASPAWKAPGDDRLLTLNISMLRLIDKQP